MSVLHFRSSGTFLGATFTSNALRNHIVERSHFLTESKWYKSRSPSTYAPQADTYTKSLPLESTYALERWHTSSEALIPFFVEGAYSFLLKEVKNIRLTLLCGLPLVPFVRESHPCALPPSAYLYSTLWHSRPGASPRSTYFCRTQHSEPSGSKPLNLSRTRLYYKSTFDALSRICTLIGHRRSLPFIRFPSNLCLNLLLELGIKSMTLWARLEPNLIPPAKRDSWVLLFDCLGSLPLRASVASLIEHTCSCLLKMYVPILIPNN